MKPFQLGLIEGFYGQAWSWQTRREYAAFLAQAGYSFYFYAPKSDPYFRKKWREPLPRDLYDNLESLVDYFHRSHLEFGVGLSPYEIYMSFDSDTKKQLFSRIEILNSLKVDRLAVLFDDMKGDCPTLAQTQVDILHWVREHSTAKHLIVCPTYYSSDPILEKLFGPQPKGYLKELGKKLNPCIDVFWTGEQICSKSYSKEHLVSVMQQIGRKPFLWDNYPVNDGPKMCKHLHLRGVSGRPSDLAKYLSGHVVNPMNQAQLSMIPVLSLSESYQKGDRYDAQETFLRAASILGSQAFAQKLHSDVTVFQDLGLDALSNEQKAKLAQDYRDFDCGAACEIRDWLDHQYTVTREVFLT